MNFTAIEIFMIIAGILLYLYSFVCLAMYVLFFYYIYYDLVGIEDKFIH